MTPPIFSSIRRTCPPQHDVSFPLKFRPHFIISHAFRSIPCFSESTEACAPDPTMLFCHFAKMQGHRSILCNRAVIGRLLHSSPRPTVRRFWVNAKHTDAEWGLKVFSNEHRELTPALSHYCCNIVSMDLQSSIESLHWNYIVAVLFLHWTNTLSILNCKTMETLL